MIGWPVPKESSVKPNDKQVAGNHYAGKYQHWDFVHDARLSYLPAQATRYLSRWKRKNGEEDLAKLRHYLEKMDDEQQKLYSSIQEFVESAELDAVEHEILLQICMGTPQSALNVLDNLESAYEPGPGYVNQD